MGSTKQMVNWSLSLYKLKEKVFEIVWAGAKSIGKFIFNNDNQFRDRLHHYEWIGWRKKLIK